MDKERLSKLYSEHHVDGKRYGLIFGGEERAAILREWVGSNKRVLDLGCRDGSLTRFYTDRNDVVGLDIDREALEKCSKNLGIVTHWTNLWDGLPFKNGEFDVVVAAEILEHLPSPGIIAEEVARVLKPGGVFVGSVPNSFRLKNRCLFFFGKDFELDPTHLHHFSPITVKETLKRFFCDIEIQYAASRFLFFWPRMFGNCMVWRCRKTAKSSDAGDSHYVLAGGTSGGGPIGGVMDYGIVKQWIKKGVDEHWPDDVFVKIARDWEEVVWRSSADHYRLRDLLAKYELRGKRILDVGCGTGLLLCFTLAQGAALAVGADIDAPRLQKTRLRAEVKGNSNSFVIQSDIRTPLSFSNACFDFAIFSNVVEHLCSSDQKQLMQELARVIKRGGVLLVCTDNPQALVYRFIEIWNRKHTPVGIPERQEWSPHFHWQELNKDQLLALVQSVGFSVVRHEFFRFPRLHKLQLSSYRPIRAIGSLLSRMPPRRLLDMSQLVVCRRSQ